MNRSNLATAEGRVAQHILDNPVRAALLGPHAHLAVRRGRVLRYRPDVAGFVSMPADPGPGDWPDRRLGVPARARRGRQRR